MIRKIVTCQGTEDRLTEKPLVSLSDSKAYEMTAEVDETITHQTMVGFGGALTEAAAITLSKMSDSKRSEVITNYYDPVEGIGYNIGRVHIHSCDFTLGNYTYVDDNDSALASFSIEHDRALILPLIKDAIKQRGSNLQILASPWSPPAWMKSNNRMNQGGYLLPEFYQSWANYYTKFVQAYEEEGVNIWGITVQNEPAASQTWDSCVYTAEEERDFVKDHLGPIMHQSGYEDKKILIWDHNRDIMVQRAKTVLDDPEAAKYVWGTGFHWYESEAFENVGKVHDLFPDKHLLFTEGCQEGGVKLGEWYTGERYGRNMIGDFNNWCEGYLDWNIVLDETGGPNHVNNLCDAPIICDTRTDEVIYNSSYYYIGHFSKYVQAGAKRIFTDCTIDKVSMAGFTNPDGKCILILMNEDETDYEISVRIKKNYLNTVVKPHSIVTYIIEE